MGVWIFPTGRLGRLVVFSLTFCIDWKEVCYWFTVRERQKVACFDFPEVLVPVVPSHQGPLTHTIFFDLLKNVPLFLIAPDDFTRRRSWVSHQAMSSRTSSIAVALRPNILHVNRACSFPSMWALYSPPVRSDFVVEFLAMSSSRS